MHGKRPGSKKANNRVRPRKLKSVILTPNSCGGRAPVLEAGEHRAVRHNTRRRSLNHYDSPEPSGRLEGHSRFEFRTLPSILFPTGFKGRPVVLCGILCPFVCLCAPLFFPGDHLLCSTTDFFFRGRVCYRPLAFPPTFIVCCLRFFVCLAFAACVFLYYVICVFCLCFFFQIV